ncbi:MAG: hypothetical protein B193_3667 [Solidesulfovibrio magneticus str. Maddingley MBC34]|uniref:Uncharacterized protein n=1 Tax=Solidesulfovibrio magneticus str. Maddingley MBC34 TaxID=1206767 RepID=K6G980_9BACT|nr:MAG: hypothetical protein B193_3667 [Solidesulfovibrio magneticus str. Maddingley MBC34]
MRVSGGTSGGTPSGGDGRDRSDPQAFKRGRQVGQIVRGRLLAPGPHGLFWVNLAGHKLLAALDHEPSPGRELVFRIERLEPELLLRDITPPPSAVDDPALLLAALAEARSRFETLLHRGPDLFAEAGQPAQSAPLAPLTARKRLFNWLTSNPDAAGLYGRIRELLRLARAFLPPQAGRPVYLPWAFPGLDASEGLVTRSGRTFTLRLFGRLAEAGRVSGIFSLSLGRASYRLSLECPEAGEGLVKALTAVRLGRRELAPVCVHLGPLSPAEAGGLFAPLVAGAARPFTGLRLRV